ncbi:MAG: hypothetical protein IJ357_07565 [Oscillospiraceae bacterium]|nr:hypothetical protein [Oscillospiraceae bacterium]
MKNSTLKTILIIVGAVVTLAGIALALVHFWDDIQKLLPCKRKVELEDFSDIDIEE